MSWAFVRIVPVIFVMVSNYARIVEAYEIMKRRMRYNWFSEFSYGVELFKNPVGLRDYQFQWTVVIST